MRFRRQRARAERRGCSDHHRSCPSLPGVGFDLVGDLAGQLGHRSLPANVRLHGRVSDVKKQWLFAQAALALNPMKVGSGSNLKLVDYLAAGLPC
jgi:hypothetical protein